MRIVRVVLAWLLRSDQPLYVPVTEWRMLRAEAWTLEQGYGWCGPVQAAPTAAQRARQKPKER